MVTAVAPLSPPRAKQRKVHKAGNAELAPSYRKKATATPQSKVPAIRTPSRPREEGRTCQRASRWEDDTGVMPRSRVCSSPIASPKASASRSALERELEDITRAAASFAPEASKRARVAKYHFTDDDLRVLKEEEAQSDYEYSSDDD